MTGLIQPKLDFIKAMEDGTLNYFSVSNKGDKIEVDGDSVRMLGRSRVLKTVYGLNVWQNDSGIDYGN